MKIEEAVKKDMKLYYFREGQLKFGKLKGIGRKFRMGVMDDGKEISDLPDQMFYIAEG